MQRSSWDGACAGTWYFVRCLCVCLFYNRVRAALVAVLLDMTVWEFLLTRREAVLVRMIKELAPYSALERLMNGLHEALERCPIACGVRVTCVRVMVPHSYTSDTFDCKHASAELFFNSGRFLILSRAAFTEAAHGICSHEPNDDLHGMLCTCAVCCASPSGWVTVSVAEKLLDTSEVLYEEVRDTARALHGHA